MSSAKIAMGSFSYHTAAELSMAIPSSAIVEGWVSVAVSPWSYDLGVTLGISALLNPCLLLLNLLPGLGGYLWPLALSLLNLFCLLLRLLLQSRARSSYHVPSSFLACWCPLQYTFYHATTLIVPRCGSLRLLHVLESSVTPKGWRLLFLKKHVRPFTIMWLPSSLSSTFMPMSHFKPCSRHIKSLLSLNRFESLCSPVEKRVILCLHWSFLFFDWLCFTLLASKSSKALLVLGSLLWLLWNKLQTSLQDSAGVRAFIMQYWIYPPTFSKATMCVSWKPWLWLKGPMFIRPWEDTCGWMVRCF